MGVLFSIIALLAGSMPDYATHMFFFYFSLVSVCNLTYSASLISCITIQPVGSGVLLENTEKTDVYSLPELSSVKEINVQKLHIAAGFATLRLLSRPASVRIADWAGTVTSYTTWQVHRNHSEPKLGKTTCLPPHSVKGVKKPVVNRKERDQGITCAVPHLKGPPLPSPNHPPRPSKLTQLL